MRRVRSFEPWMISNLVSGAVMGAFVVLLIPPFITEVTGSAARVGVVFAVMSLAGLTGPAVARVADRFDAHRVVYTAAFAAMAVAFAVLALDVTAEIYSPIAGILLGAGISAKAVIGSGFLVGSGLPEAMQARQLTVFNLMIFGGQLVGGLLVTGLHLAGMSTLTQFWLVAALIAAAAVFTWFTTALPESRLRAAAQGEPGGARVGVAVTGPAGAAHAPARPRMLRSPFAALIAAIAFTAIGMSVLSSQIANILPAVFSISATTTSVLVATAGLLGVPAVIVSGVWLGRSGAAPALALSLVVRAAGFVLLALIGLAAGGPAVASLAGVLYLVVVVTSSLQRSPLPRAAALLSHGSPSEANGLVNAAGAAGAFIGCLGAGIIAEAWSYEAVLWFAGAAAAAAALFVPSIVRALRRSAGDDAVHAVSPTP